MALENESKNTKEKPRNSQISGHAERVSRRRKIRVHLTFYGYLYNAEKNQRVQNTQ